MRIARSLVLFFEAQSCSLKLKLLTGYTDVVQIGIKSFWGRPAIIWSGVSLGLLGGLGLLIFGSQTAYARLYDNRIFPGVKILNVRLYGLTKNEAREVLQKTIDENLSKGLRFVFRGQEAQLETAWLAQGSDAARDFISYEIEESLRRAYAVGRGGFWLGNFSAQVSARVAPVNLPAKIFIDEAAVNEALRAAFKSQIAPPQDAKFVIAFAADGAPFIHIENEKSGNVLKTAEAVQELRRQAARLDFRPIALTEELSSPAVRREDLEPLSADLVEILQRPPLIFTYDNQKYTAGPKIFSNWMAVKTEHGQPRLEIDDELFAQDLRRLAPQIERLAKNGSLVIKDGKIESFEAGTQGIAFEIEKILAAVRRDWPEKSSFLIEVKVTSGSLLGEDPERLGVKEIIGVGRSNFKGSPVNRRKNIRKGSQVLTGALIPPGQEFSLVGALGEIDGAHGWFPELVIKGNETVPEFGGGLCQIGTTVFRAALNTGLKITERRNHSYRVRYYEPAGTDATIYDPSPDLRFINDTQAHILINSYLQGDDLMFEFWGTGDGRKVDPYKSAIYNITEPPSTKLVETLDLEPGQKTCTESAHAGADAHFTYRVTYADGSRHEEVFRSHYRPWQAVCLVGVEELSVPTSTSGIETDAEAGAETEPAAAAEVPTP